MAQAQNDGGSLSLAEHIGELFGDFDGFSEPAAPESTATGTPQPPDAPAPNARPSAAPEGASPTAPEGTPPEAPGATTPDTAASPEAAPGLPADPLADATPFTYTVDGVQKTYDGIKVLGQDGAIIDSPDVLADLQRKLGERDHLYDANQKLYQQTREIDALGGTQKFVDLQKEFASINAAGNLLASLIGGEVKGVLRLLQQNEDGSVTWNAAARDDLLDKVRLVADRAEFQTEQTLQAARATAQAAGQQQGQDGAVMQAGIEEAVSTLTKMLPDWQAEDVAALRKHVTAYAPFLIRPATAEDVRQYPHLVLGHRFIDLPKLAPWVEDREAVRTREKALVTTTAAASKDNASRLAQAVRPSAAPARPAPPPMPSDRKTDAGDAWDMMESLSASSLRGANP